MKMTKPSEQFYLCYHCGSEKSFEYPTCLECKKSDDWFGKHPIAGTVVKSIFVSLIVGMFLMISEGWYRRGEIESARQRWLLEQGKERNIERLKLLERANDSYFEIVGALAMLLFPCDAKVCSERLSNVESAIRDAFMATKDSGARSAIIKTQSIYHTRRELAEKRMNSLTECHQEHKYNIEKLKDESLCLPARESISDIIHKPIYYCMSFAWCTTNEKIQASEKSTWKGIYSHGREEWAPFNKDYDCNKVIAEKYDICVEGSIEDIDKAAASFF